jgi:hypothetical protein
MAEKQHISVQFEQQPIGDYKEELISFIFTESQIKSLQNEMAVIANEKLGMPATEEFYQLKQEWARGWMECIAFLLAKSKNAQDTLSQVLQSSPQQD